MTTYAAFLGHQPKVSIAELAATVEGFSLKKVYGNSAVLFESTAELTQKHLNNWGGTVLLAQEIVPNGNMDNIPALLGKEVEDVKGKVTFALRASGVSPQKMQGLYRDCKKYLVKSGKSARYVGNENKPAATALLRDEGIASGKHGCEIILLTAEKEPLWIGKTIAAQDPDAYTKRDMEKPVRDTRVGLLPPKLAQILLNLGAWAVTQQLGKMPKEIVVFDPFCGTGVIPMEALIKKWNVLASDVSAKAVTGCEKNIEWVRKEHEIKKKDVTSEVWKQDATKAFELDPMPHVIVTEGSLGPALLERPLAKDAQKLRVESDALELAFLKNLAASVPNVPIVITFPVWYLKNGSQPLERVWKSLPDLGYEAVLPGGLTGDEAGRPSIVYRRPDQFVGREIVVLRPIAKA